MIFQIFDEKSILIFECPGYQNSLTVLYSQVRTPSTTIKSTRHIPSAPERILDAPEIIDDYCKYLNFKYLKLSARLIEYKVITPV